MKKNLLRRIMPGLLSLAMVFSLGIKPVQAEELTLIEEDDPVICDTVYEDESKGDDVTEDVISDLTDDVYPETDVTDDFDNNDIINDAIYETTLSEDLIEEVPVNNDTVENDGAGSGSASDPILIHFGDTIDTNSRINSYYYFVPEEDGVVTIEGYSKQYPELFRLELYAGYTDKNHLILDQMMDSKGGIYTLCRIGVKGGERYTAYTKHGNTAGFSLRMSFEASSLWEAELDSEAYCKDMVLNKAYNGYTCDADKCDYYHFNLPGSATVYINYDRKQKGSMTLYSDNTFSNDSKIEWTATGKISKKLKAGDYYIKLGNGTIQDPGQYTLKVTTKGLKLPFTTGSATLNGQKVTSLKEAFKMMNKAGDYVINLESDMIGEPNLTVPSKATSLTINGNGFMIKIKGNKFTSKAPLTLNNVTFKTVNKKDNPCKMTFAATKGLKLDNGILPVTFDASSVILKAGKTLENNGELAVNSLTADDLSLGSGARLNIRSGCSVNIKKSLVGESGCRINLEEGFKPIKLGGTASGKVRLFTASSLTQGKQILSAKTKKLSKDALKDVFDVSGVNLEPAGVTCSKSMYYYKGGNAGIYYDAISYNGNRYGLWKDVAAQMDADKKAGATEFTVDLNMDTNAYGALKLPKKGYKLLTINGNGHTLSFTNNLKLTGDTTVNYLTLKRINKKGQQIKGKVTKGKYNYNGPIEF